jgi:hypothetical protein
MSALPARRDRTEDLAGNLVNLRGAEMAEPIDRCGVSGWEHRVIRRPTGRFMVSCGQPIRDLPASDASPDVRRWKRRRTRSDMHRARAPLDLSE